MPSHFSFTALELKFVEKTNKHTKKNKKQNNPLVFLHTVRRKLVFSDTFTAIKNGVRELKRQQPMIILPGVHYLSQCHSWRTELKEQFHQEKQLL